MILIYQSVRIDCPHCRLDFLLFASDWFKQVNVLFYEQKSASGMAIFEQRDNTFD